MRLLRLVGRSVWFYRRTNLGVLLACLAATAVLTGALAVGDSMRQTLQMKVEERLGGIESALVGGDRFFRAALADELGARLGAKTAPLLHLRGMISNSEGTARVNSIEVLGVDERFYGLSGAHNPFSGEEAEQIVLNEALAGRLGVKAGEQVVLRMEKPSAMARDIALAPETDRSIAIRLTVSAVAGSESFGSFSLQSSQMPALNAFVRLVWLQKQTSRMGLVNVLVAGGEQAGMTVEAGNAALREHIRLADVGLELRRLREREVIEVRSRRVFIDESLGEAAMSVSEEAAGILTYFVNELRCGDRATPYSTVAAVSRGANGGGIIPADMKDNEILINNWLAEDLGAGVGETIELTYSVVTSGRKLAEKKSVFTVRGIVPLEGVWLDPELMPEFPGLSGVENCRDWEPGIDIELDKIRERDEAYWDHYRGTPKAFVTLSAGKSMWANRYGTLTAVRYVADEEAVETIARKILSRVEPASVGLYFEPVRRRLMRASSEGTDFGQLFLGLSMFIIASAVILTALIFVFGVESRSEQVGILKALGFTGGLVKRVLLLEGGAIAAIGAIAGTIAGLIYTKAMLYGLATVWKTAVSGTRIEFHVEASTLAIGVLGGVAIAVAAMWVTLRRLVLQPAHELLTGTGGRQFWQVGRGRRGILGLFAGLLATAGAVLLVVFLPAGDSTTATAAFFGAGALLLVGGLGFGQFLLRHLQVGLGGVVRSLGGLAVRNASRRVGRSLAVVGLLASGVFLVIAVGANKQDVLAEADRRDSGTGGFALFGQSCIGILHDLNSDKGRAKVGLDGEELAGVRFVGLRVRAGDEASCLNLNRAQKPRLLGVEPEHLSERGSFRFLKVVDDAEKKDGWGLLKTEYGAEVVGAIGDYPTVVWALGKSVGDEIEFTDEKGRKFLIRIVGMIASSVLQGNLVISEERFVERFPSESGYRMFLIDAPAGTAEAVSGRLSRVLGDFGFEVRPAAERLAGFAAVENTYLSIFQLLGGPGVVLGSIGLGLVVLRNVLERRGELAMLRAVGFDKRGLKKMVMYEHTGLVAAGLVLGTGAAVVAVWPAVAASRSEVPYMSLAAIVAAIAISGVVWIWLATGAALSGEMLGALRNE